MGHSMGGGGALYAGLQRPSLKATIGLAPAIFSENLTNLRVPAMLMAGQNDGTVTPSSVMNAYNQIPASTEKAYLELNNANHYTPNSTNSTISAYTVSWMKRFVDDDLRYDQFLCPPPAPSSTIEEYRSTCPHA